MKKLMLFMGSFALLVSTSWADTITYSTVGNITSGSNANASDVSTAFNEVKTAVDANDGNITALQTGSGSCVGNNASDIMFRFGSICIDQYTSSLWDGTGAGAGATTAAASGCDGDTEGRVGCSTLFAQSRLTGTRANGITISWGMAVRACANSGKRLMTPAEWTMAWQSSNMSDIVTGLNDLEWIDGVSSSGGTKIIVGTIGQSLDVGAGIWQLEYSTGAEYDQTDGTWGSVHFRCAR